jgi:protein-S-isoprenylcysteine O-methyltransferase Ste14
MTVVHKVILFVLATIGITWVSRSSLLNIQFHGFYRFFAWETILILFLVNMNYWFVDPISLRQIISWSFLIVSLLLIYQGVQLFRRKRRLDQERNEPALVGIEKTTELVTTGVYHYIRHPFYSSLLFLGWGMLFKNVSLIGIILAIIATTLLIMTAKKEEIENIEFFGEKYREYMKNTKIFVPFIY